ncbi:MAG: class II aldolase/adducin family protein [Bacillota bacterium]
MTIDEAKARVVQAGKRLVQSGLIARTWGNVSCRISESRFVITPSGRDYLSLTPADIVTVEIADCSYKGHIKPSSEKGIHAEVYKSYPQINFVIHTHQENASVVSVLGLDSIMLAASSSLLGSEVICASYGLPGTKKLRRAVSKALARSAGNSVILKYHGALCFGKDDEEAFKVAEELENACAGFIAEHYLKISGRSGFDPGEMRGFALSLLTSKAEISGDCPSGFYCESERTDKGFKLQLAKGGTFEVMFDQIPDSLPREAIIHNAVYQKYKNIKYIIHMDTPNILAVSCAGIILRPLLDDFAQIAGTSVKTAGKDPAKIAAALKGASAVLIRNNGALCCGISKGDATAVGMVMEKNSKALIGAAIFGNVKPINYLESCLMRLVYLKKYSKQAAL